MQQCVYERKICDIDDLQKRLMQTWFDFKQNVIDHVIDKWRDRLRSCVHAGVGNFEHMLRNCSLHFAWVVDHEKCIVVTHVCVSVSVPVRVRMPTLLHGPDPHVTWGSGRGCPLVVHYLADLQWVHGLRCYGNTMDLRGRAQQ